MLISYLPRHARTTNGNVMQGEPNQIHQGQLNIEMDSGMFGYSIEIRMIFQYKLHFRSQNIR